jgi:hypothetical protein
MTKQRKSPTILKPVIDEEIALRFAAAGSRPALGPSTDGLPKSASKLPAAKKGSSDEIEKDMRQISIAISKGLYDRIAKEAARKNRTVEEHLKKHLTKRYDK